MASNRWSLSKPKVRAYIRFGAPSRSASQHQEANVQSRMLGLSSALSGGRETRPRQGPEDALSEVRHELQGRATGGQRQRRHDFGRSSRQPAGSCLCTASLQQRRFRARQGVRQAAGLVARSTRAHHDRCLICGSGLGSQAFRS